MFLIFIQTIQQYLKGLQKYFLLALFVGVTACNNKWTEEQYKDYASKSDSIMQLKQKVFEDEFLTQSYDSWEPDLKNGTIIYKKYGLPTLECIVLVVGSFSEESNTWMWAWKSDSTLADQKDQLLEIKQFGEKHKIRHLRSGLLYDIEESECWEFTAIAGNLLNAIGATSIPQGDGFYTYALFMDAKWLVEPGEQVDS